MRNPWDPSRSAGGSSSGSAALVAAGAADLALGGDQGGSVRIPSSFCGTVGHKPTYGLVPYTGAFPIENTLDHLGPITRTVRDAALLLSVLAGPDGLDPRQRTGTRRARTSSPGWTRVRPGCGSAVVQEGFGIPGVSQPGVDETVRAAIAALAAAGAEVSEVSVPLHRHGLDIWNVIATDGATSQMIDGNGYGMNWPGCTTPNWSRTTPGAAGNTATSWPTRSRWPCSPAGTRSTRATAGTTRWPGTWPWNWPPPTTTRSRADVLVMPTLPVVAKPIPAAGRAGGVPRRRRRDDRQHRAVRRHRPSGDHGARRAGRRPAGRADDRRPQFGDATCLRVAQAFETAVGGSAPPGY